MKDWQRRMDGFSCGSKSGKCLPALVLTKDQNHLSQGISWSSSDEEDNVKRSVNRKRIVMTRLNFEECIRSTRGHAKPKVSRSLIESSPSSLIVNDFQSPGSSHSKHLDLSVSIDAQHLTPSFSPNCEYKSALISQDINKNDDPTLIPVQSPPLIDSPKSPIISLSRRRKNTSAFSDSQLPFTPRPVSPIISRKKFRSTSRRRQVTSPILRKRKKRRKLLSEDLQTSSRYLEDSLTVCSQAISVVYSPPASKQVSTFLNQHIQGSSQEIQIEVNSSPIDLLESESKENLEFVPTISEVISQNTQTSFQRAKMSLPIMTNHQKTLFHYISSQDIIIDDYSQESSSTTQAIIDVASSQEPASTLGKFQLAEYISAAPASAHFKNEIFDQDDFQIEVPVSSSSQSTIASDSLLDSACKTKRGKPVKNGLLWRLNRLLARQRSSQRMWQHERAMQSEISSEKGYQLYVRSVKISWGRTLVHCQAISSREQLVVILPPGKKIQAGSCISIFPPWQQFEPPGFGMPVLLGVSLMEVNKSQDNELATEAPPSVHSSIDNFTCYCRQDPIVSWHECKFQLPEQQLLKLLFWPPEEQVERGRLLAVEATGDKELTVAAAVSSHSRDPVQPLQLIIFCHRLCAYRIPVNLDGLATQRSESSQGSTQGCSNRQWCALGQDSQGEICLVELGRRTGPLKEGALFHLRDLTLSRRTEAARSPRLYSIIISLFPQTLQTIVFEFSSPHCQALRLAEEPDNFTWVPPSLASPETVISTSQEQRVTLLAILLYFHSSSILYVQPVSSEWEESSIPYVRVTVQPSALLPSKLHPNTLFCLRDLSCINGELFLDRFSAVINLTSHTGPQLLNWIPKVSAVKCLPLPSLFEDSVIGDLVSVKGTVISVDEDDACVWPACRQCGSDILKEVSPHMFECSTCGSNGPFSNKVSLTVELSGHVTVKLQQKTIEQLLPDCQNNSECYSLESVLGQSLELLKCYVAEKSQVSISLEELTL